jgi:hypothetical protein
MASLLPVALIVQESNVAHLSVATLLPAAQLTLPHSPKPNLEELYAPAEATIVSPQFTLWFGLAQGELADVPLFESLPEGER